MTEEQSPKAVSGGRAAVSTFYVKKGSVADAMKASDLAEKGIPEEEFAAAEADESYAGEPFTAEAPVSPQRVVADLKRHIGHIETEQSQLNETLRLYNMTKDDAEKIIDALMVQNKRYHETVPLLAGRVDVVFQTRHVSDYDLLTQVMEERRPQFVNAVSAEQWRHNLAASIVRYGNKRFKTDSMKNYAERISWVNSLNEPLYNMLLVALQEFDKKTNAVLAPAFLRNF